MGFLSRLFGGGGIKISGAVMLNGGREVEVVGESHYQPALERAAGGRQREGVHVPVIATLMPEPRNKFDKNAIAIQLDGQTVGYLARTMARSYGPLVRRLLDEGHLGQCQAVIVGGWDRGLRDRGSFGIWLDLATPAKAMPHGG
jgi:hypothetical protein